MVRWDPQIVFEKPKGYDMHSDRDKMLVISKKTRLHTNCFKIYEYFSVFLRDLERVLQTCGTNVSSSGAVRLDFDLVNQCVYLEIVVSEFGYFCHACVCVFYNVGTFGASQLIMRTIPEFSSGTLIKVRAKFHIINCPQ